MNPANFLKASAFVRDINQMHNYFGHHDAVDAMDGDTLDALAKFRVDFIKEEYDELCSSYDEGNAEEFVDALIDLIVVAIGTLDLFNINIDQAWDEVHRANMSKQSGIKDGRPNPLGLPDLLKPNDWVAPSHANNHGKLAEAFAPLTKARNEDTSVVYETSTQTDFQIVLDPEIADRYYTVTVLDEEETAVTLTRE